MKNFAIVTPERVIKIRMPMVVFWLFKRFAVVQSERHAETFSGESMAYVIIDEGGSKNEESQIN